MVLILLLVNRHTTLLLSKSKAKVWSSLHYNDDESIYQLKIEICKCKTCVNTPAYQFVLFVIYLKIL